MRLVITDLNMPEMDGLTLLDCLAEAWPGVPSLVVSAYGDSGRMSAARDRGSSGFVVKPVDFDPLRSAMADSLDGGVELSGERLQDRSRSWVPWPDGTGQAAREWLRSPAVPVVGGAID